MSWVRRSDDHFRDPVTRRLGAQAALLEEVVLGEVACREGDGVLTVDLDVADAAYRFKLKAAAATAKLLAAGRWHDQAGVDACIPCRDHPKTRPLAENELLVHVWWDRLLDSDGKTDGVKRKRENRRKALNRDVQLVALIRERDRDLCRYCGVLTKENSGGDKRSARIRQLDHVDPWGDNDLGNVVVACRRCNAKKANRTPEEARMPLLEPGTGHHRYPTQSDADPTQSDGDHGSEPTPLEGTGPGRDGPGRPDADPTPSDASGRGS